jgi:hypothetical protein
MQPLAGVLGSMDINEGEEVMTGKKQQIEREELRAAKAITIRALSILAAIAALAVSAAPVASAGTSKKPPSQAVDAKRGLDAFEDGDELFETVYNWRKAQPKPARDYSDESK